METRLPFPESFETLAVPAALDIIDDEALLTETREHFFDHVRTSLKLGPLAISMFCLQKEEGDEHELWFSDIQPLASTIETHGEAGWHVIFSKKRLFPRTMQLISEIETIDSIIPGPRR